MDSLLAHVQLADVHDDLFRNIVSIRQSQDLFDDLSEDPQAWRLAQQVEDDIKPPLYQSRSPVIHRPFEDAQWFSAIGWPFKHWQASRFSDGSFGVWYGCESVETTVYETAYHWFHGLLSDAGFASERGMSIVGERKLYQVRCDAALLDLRPTVEQYPELLHRSDYSATQYVGARLHCEGHPGLVTWSVRRPQGFNFAVLNPGVLSSPRPYCYLTYRLEANTVVVEKQPGMSWLEVDVSLLS
jgi:hypothetical protein